MEQSKPTNVENSSYLLNESYSCFDDDDGADFSATESPAYNVEETLSKLKSSRRRLVRPVIVAFTLGFGAVVSIIAGLATKHDDLRLCQEAATQGAKSMQVYAQDSLRTQIDTSGFIASSGGCVSSWPAVFSVILAMCFILAAVGFTWYDRRQQARFDKAQQLAERTTNLVASLYPKQVRDRLLNVQDKASKASDKKKAKVVSIGTDDLRDGSLTAGKTANTVADVQSGEAQQDRLGQLQDQQQPKKRALMARNEGNLGDGDDTGELFSSRPIADLFPSTTLVRVANPRFITARSSTANPLTPHCPPLSHFSYSPILQALPHGHQQDCRQKCK
jgi:hypothetical protein